MTKIRNVRKVFNFVIQINGIDQFRCQKFKIPDIETEVTKHGDTNKDVKTPGRVVIGEWTAETITPIESTTDEVWNWLLRAQNPTTGTGGLANDYMEVVTVREVAPNGRTILNTYILDEAWISKISKVTYDRMSSDNIIDTITGQCNDLQRY